MIPRPMTLALGMIFAGVVGVAAQAGAEDASPSDLRHAVVRAGMAEHVEMPFLATEPRISPRSLFSPDVTEIFWWAQFKPFTFFSQATLHAQIYTPDGGLVTEANGVTFLGHLQHAMIRIPLSEVKTPLPQGQWRIVVSWKDRLVDDRTFFVGTPQVAAATGSALPAAQRAQLASRQWSLAAEARQRGDWPRAAALLDAAIAVAPDRRPTVRLLQGLLHVERGAYQDAIAALSNLQSEQPQEVWSYYGLAEAYRSLGQLENAQQMLNAAFELAPHAPETCGFLALLAGDRGDVEVAKQWFAYGLSVAPDDPELLEQSLLVKKPAG